MGIYHEKQIGSLCAVHCLNNLVQDSYFDEVELAEIGQSMDRFVNDNCACVIERQFCLCNRPLRAANCLLKNLPLCPANRAERLALAGSGLESESANVRADGFFSIQVRARV